MKILLLATRDIDGPQTGRKSVLRTIVRSCEALGHTVDVAVMGSMVAGSRCIPVKGPALIEVCVNLVWHFVFGRKSLNECLYWRRGAPQQISQLIIGGAYALVIADMVRTAQFCRGLPVPWILDLDDLLSVRYAGVAEVQDGRGLLGYFAERLPAPSRRAAAWVARRLLRAEARRIALQELYFGARADAVTLVSSTEARTLSKQLGRVVHDTPMSIDLGGAVATGHAGRELHAVVFVGGLDYQPNLDALRYYLDQIAPELEQLGCLAELHVIGNAPLELRPMDRFGRTVYVGYADDMASVLARYAVSVAPIPMAGGIKTKVLEAMACGLAVVATAQAVAGLGITPEQECRVARSPAEFALAIKQLLGDADTCARMGRAARDFVCANFSHAVLQAKWAVLLEEALGHFQARCLDARVHAGF